MGKKKNKQALSQASSSSTGNHRTRHSVKLTAFHAISINFDKDPETIIDVYLEYKTNINMKDSDGNSLLHLASQVKNTRVVAHLLERGASINSLNHAGKTPLHIAAQEGHHEIVTLLLQNKHLRQDAMDSSSNKALDLCEYGPRRVIYAKSDNINNLDTNYIYLLSSGDYHFKDSLGFVQEGTLAQFKNKDESVFEKLNFDNENFQNILLDEIRKSFYINESTLEDYLRVKKILSEVKAEKSLITLEMLNKYLENNSTPRPALIKDLLSIFSHCKKLTPRHYGFLTKILFLDSSTPEHNADDQPAKQNGTFLYRDLYKPLRPELLEKYEFFAVIFERYQPLGLNFFMENGNYVLSLEAPSNVAGSFYETFLLPFVKRDLEHYFVTPGESVTLQEGGIKILAEALHVNIKKYPKFSLSLLQETLKILAPLPIINEGKNNLSIVFNKNQSFFIKTDQSKNIKINSNSAKNLVVYILKHYFNLEEKHLKKTTKGIILEKSLLKREELFLKENDGRLEGDKIIHQLNFLMGRYHLKLINLIENNNGITGTFKLTGNKASSLKQTHLEEYMSCIARELNTSAIVATCNVWQIDICLDKIPSVENFNAPFTGPHENSSQEIVGRLAFTENTSTGKHSFAFTKKLLKHIQILKKLPAEVGYTDFIPPFLKMLFHIYLQQYQQRAVASVQETLGGLNKFLGENSNEEAAITAALAITITHHENNNIIILRSFIAMVLISAMSDTHLTFLSEVRNSFAELFKKKSIHLHAFYVTVEKCIHLEKNIDTTDISHEKLCALALHYAVKIKAPKFLKTLVVEFNFNINQWNEFGLTPLHSAIEKDLVDMSRTLLALGANIAIQNSQGVNAMDFAMEYFNPDIVVTLEEHNKKYPTGNTLFGFFNSSPPRREIFEEPLPESCVDSTHFSPVGSPKSQY